MKVAAPGGSENAILPLTASDPRRKRNSFLIKRKMALGLHIPPLPTRKLVISPSMMDAPRMAVHRGFPRLGNALPRLEMTKMTKKPIRAAVEASGEDERVEVNQRALIDTILGRYASAGDVYRELLQNSNDAEATVAEIRFTTTTTTTSAACNKNNNNETINGNINSNNNGNSSCLEVHGTGLDAMVCHGSGWSGRGMVVFGIIHISVIIIITS
jgi:hypothetical protein